jgi:membrane-bound serine protease (ClpP class)
MKIELVTARGHLGRSGFNQENCPGILPRIVANRGCCSQDGREGGSVLAVAGVMRYAGFMKIGLAIILFILSLSQFSTGHCAPSNEKPAPRKVYILPIRDDIMPPLVYIVRRGVKEAIQANADLLVLDMETNGGRVDVTEEIIEILNQFKGKTVTYVNRKAFSAGAFISVATQKIYMSPQSVIGAAAPLLMAPGGGGTEMPATMEAKMTSGIRALVRTSAEKNGHNVEVVEAMIDKTRALEIDGEVLNEKGQILTLTNKQAEKEYGNPPKPLLSAGTVESLDELITNLGYSQADRVHVEPTGVERIATWINTISPLLLLIGIVGVYIEFKTPGFGIPGIVGIIAFAIYFLGGYIAGLSGAEWLAVFILGLFLFVLELFVFPGTILLGLTGAALMLGSIIMAMVDIYPGVPGLPGSMQFRVPMKDILVNLSIVFVGSSLAFWVLSFWLPKTSLYSTLISGSASGESSVILQEQAQTKRVGEVGVAVSVLRPGGKAQFGEEILDVISQGEMIPKGRRVKIIGHSSTEAIVEALG